MELNKAVLDCMKTLRRRIREETALDIRLSQPDAIACMLEACMNSHDLETRRLGGCLAALSDSDSTHSIALSPAVSRQPAPEFHSPAEPSSGQVRMYRGQRVIA